VYESLRLIHSYWRWAVLLLGLAALVRALGKRPWSRTDQNLWRAFISALDVQVLIGLALYFIWSPFSQAIFHDFRAAMKSHDTRFFGIEHITAMLIAAVVAHIGNRRLKTSNNPRRTALITLLIWLVLVAVAIPWPWTPHGRPLFR
jgi:hypothetical protein